MTIVPAGDDPAQGPDTAGTISEVNSRSVSAPAPATLKLVVVTTTTTPCSGKTYTLFPPVPYIPYVGMHGTGDRKSTRLSSSHQIISYAVFCLKNKREHLQLLA